MPDGVAPALAAGRTGDQRHLAGHAALDGPDSPGVGGIGSPVVAWIAAGTGPQPAHLEGEAPTLEDGFEDRAGRHAVAGPQRAGTLQVEVLVGQPVAAVDHQGSGHRAGRPCPRVLEVDLSSSSRRSSGPELAPDTGLLQAGVGIGQVTGQGQQRAGDLVGGHQGDIAARRGQPLGHAHADRAAHRVVDDDRAVGQGSAPPASADRASTTGTEPSPGTVDGAGRPPVASTTVCPPAGGVEVVGGHLHAGLDHDAEPVALGAEPVGQAARRSRPGPTAAVTSVPPTWPSARPPGPGGPGGRGPGHTRARPARHPRPGRRPPGPAVRGPASADRVDRLVAGPGSPTQLTRGLRLSRTRQAWLHRMQGRTSTATPSRTLATSRGRRSGPGSSRPGLPSRRPGPTRPWSGRPRSPASTTGTRPAAARRIGVASSRLNPAGVWASGR